MDILQAIVLGLVQGFGEFLPISSSGHLVLIPWIFGWEDQGLSFDVALHFGTLIAVVSFFWKEWLAIFCAFFGIRNKFCEGKKYPANFLLILIAGTIPGALLGFLFEDKVATLLRSPWIIVTTLITFGGLLYVADLKAKLLKETNSITFKQIFLIGCAQALALIPGTSRSGITITAGLALGFTRKGCRQTYLFCYQPQLFLEQPYSN